MEPEGKIFTLLMEDSTGTIENKVKLYRNDAGALVIQILSAIDLTTNNPCKPCSAERLRELINTYPRDGI